VKVLVLVCQIAILFSPLVANQSQSSSASLQRAPIGVGDIAPDFTLEDQNHKQITLSDARSHVSVVLVFYRGYW
jgi:cytochrome oxidase Cu insertion factor (SCO1/SenC/PrrC family)